MTGPRDDDWPSGSLAQGYRATKTIANGASPHSSTGLTQGTAKAISLQKTKRRLRKVARGRQDFQLKCVVFYIVSLRRCRHGGSIIGYLKNITLHRQLTRQLLLLASEALLMLLLPSSAPAASTDIISHPQRQRQHHTLRSALAVPGKLHLNFQPISSLQHRRCEGRT